MPLPTAAVADEILTKAEQLGYTHRDIASFNEVLAQSPAQYLRTVRLNRVRRELRTEEATNVQDVAARWGFWHMSRFAQSYHAMFGELPSETLREKRTVRVAA